MGLPEAGEAFGVVKEEAVYAESLEWFQRGDGIKEGIKEPWFLLKLSVSNRCSVRWWECCVPDNLAT